MLLSVLLYGGLFAAIAGAVAMLGAVRGVVPRRSLQPASRSLSSRCVVARSRGARDDERVEARRDHAALAIR